MSYINVGNIASDSAWELIDSLEQGIAVYESVDDGDDFIFLAYNQAGSRMDQTEPDTVLGKRLTEVFPGVREFGLLKILKRVWLSGEPEILPPSQYNDGRVFGWRENRVFRLTNGNVVAVYKDVTAEHRAIAAVKTSELRYQMLTDATLDGVWEWNVKQDTLYLSPRWKSQLGYNDHELANKFDTFIELLHPEDRETVQMQLERFLNDPEPIWSSEFRLKHKSGKYSWFMARGICMTNMDNVIEKIFGVHIDIHEQKLLQEEIEANKERLAFALHAGELGLYDLDIPSGKAIVNEQYALMLGFDPESFHETHQALLDRIHPEERPDVEQAYLDYVNGSDDDYRIEFRSKTANGDWLWIQSIGRAVEYDQDGNPMRMIGIHTNIDEIKRTEERLQQSAQVFSSTIEGVCITDTHGTILDVNEAFTTITGYQKEEVVGQNPRVLKSGKHDKDFYSHIWAELTSKGSWHGEIWNRKKNGTIYPEFLTISAVKNGHGLTGYVGVFTDITSAKQDEERLEFLAHHDPLTRLPNRLLFHARLKQAIKYAERRHQKLAVIYIDLDRFKHINDTLGHAIGDELLIECASRLESLVRGDDTVARLGGDEFAAIIEDVSSAENVVVVVNKIMQLFDRAFKIQWRDLRVTCSLGISLYPDDGSTLSELLSSADTAMYAAKNEGRNGYQFFTKRFADEGQLQIFMENELRNAIRHKEFFLVYQPQLDMFGGGLHGLEALVRWQHPRDGVYLPGCFIPVAERSGQIIKIGEWIIDEACRQASIWLEQGFEFGKISVNCSSREVQQPNFADFVLRKLAHYDVGAEYLELEVTESFVIAHRDEAERQLRKLQDNGISIAIDDFGTGFSSLSYLQSLPVNKLKIDQSFVRNIPDDKNNCAISNAVIALGKTFKLTIVAEGIETLQQLEYLRNNNCDIGQGYLYSIPLEADKVEVFLKQTEPA